MSNQLCEAVLSYGTRPVSKICFELNIYRYVPEDKIRTTKVWAFVIVSVHKAVDKPAAYYLHTNG